MKTIINTACLFILFINTLVAANYYVKTPADGGNDANDGLSWENAKATIQGAFSASEMGDHIFVKYGTYSISSQITFSHLRKLTSDDGTHTSWSEAVPDSSQCILEGNNCRIFYALQLNSWDVIRGFKITGGDATNEITSAHMGGGLLLRDGGLIIERCWITGNTANTVNSSGYGGGINFQDNSGGSSPIIRNCRFDNNIASTNHNGMGGAIFCMDHTSLTLENNIFDNNIASNASWGYGGALYLGKSATLKNNIFSNNIASNNNITNDYNSFGGAIYNVGNSSIYNNVFYKNVYNPFTNWNLGDALYILSGTPSIKNNIFLSHNFPGSNRTVINSTSLITIQYNSFFDNTNKYNVNVTSTNETTIDPLLSEPSNGDFTLQSGSPCVDSGDPSFSVPEGGEPQIDIGAYEFISRGQQVLGNINNDIENNLFSGLGISIASESGLINANVQQNLSDPSNLPEGSRHIGKYWTVSGLTGNAKIRLYYCEEACLSFSGSPIIYHYTEGVWQALPTNAEVTVGCCRYVETTNTYSNFSDVTVGDSEAPLPVELTSFTASLNNGVKLNWETATEVNNYGFEIERQYQVASSEYQDSSNWEMIGFVEGHGTTNSPKQYSFTDNLTLNPNLTLTRLCYRLKQIDLDGAVSYSKVVNVDISDITSVEEEIPVEYSLSQNFPNPFNPTTNIKFAVPTPPTSSPLAKGRTEEGFVKLVVYDILGSEVATLVNQNLQPGNYEVQFDASSLSTGMYLYRIDIGNKFSSIKKMLLIK